MGICAKITDKTCLSVNKRCNWNGEVSSSSSSSRQSICTVHVLSCQLFGVPLFFTNFNNVPCYSQCCSNFCNSQRRCKVFDDNGVAVCRAANTKCTRNNQVSATYIDIIAAYTVLVSLRCAVALFVALTREFSPPLPNSCTPTFISLSAAPRTVTTTTGVLV